MNRRLVAAALAVASCAWACASAPANSDAGGSSSGHVTSSSMMTASSGPGVEFGGLCTVDADCAETMCRAFVQMTVLRCTRSCTSQDAAQRCPSPPSAGTCTGNGYCRFTQ